MSCKFTAKQISKKSLNKKIVYEFAVYIKDEPFIYDKTFAPTRNEKGEFLVCPKKKNFIFEEIEMQAKLTVSVDKGSTKKQIESAVKRQLLELKINHECDEPNVDEMPDFEEISVE